MYNSIFNAGNAEAAGKYVKEYFESYNPAKTHLENKVEFLMKNIPGLTCEKALKDVEAISEGCETYRINIESRLRGEKYTMKTFFEENLADLSAEEKYLFAEKMLKFVYAADALTVYENTGELNEELLEKVRAEVTAKTEIKEGSVTSEDLEEILNELEKALNSTVIAFSGTDKMLEELEKTDSASFISAEKPGEKSELKEVTALANYIVYCNEISGEEDVDVSAEQIAVLTSGAIDRHNVIMCAAAGGAPREEIKELLIAIGGAIITVLFAFAALSSMVLFAEIGLVLAEIIFAESLLAAILCMLGGIGIWGLMMLGVMSIIDACAEDIEIIADKVAEKTAGVLYNIGVFIKNAAAQIFGRKPSGAALNLSLPKSVAVK